MKEYAIMMPASGVALNTPRDGWSHEDASPQSKVIVFQQLKSAVIFWILIPDGGRFYNGHADKGALFLSAWATSQSRCSDPQ